MDRIEHVQRRTHCGRDSSDGALFASHRAQLFRIAYRMLGSRAEADDIAQDVYLRWHHSARDDIESPIAFLVTITKRLCLDRLRELRHRHADCVDASLSESDSEQRFPSPETQLECADDVAVALRAVLERLGDEERAAFLLHDVFDYEYPEVAHLLGKTEPTCRQMIHRARTRVRDPHPRFATTAQTRERIVETFLAATRTSDRNALGVLLADRAPAPSRLATRVDYLCPGRAQEGREPGTAGVYEMDNETYQTTTLG